MARASTPAVAGIGVGTAPTPVTCISPPLRGISSSSPRYSAISPVTTTCVPAPSSSATLS